MSMYLPLYIIWNCNRYYRFVYTKVNSLTFICRCKMMGKVILLCLLPIGRGELYMDQYMLLSNSFMIDDVCTFYMVNTCLFAPFIMNVFAYLCTYIYIFMIYVMPTYCEMISLDDSQPIQLYDAWYWHGNHRTKRTGIVFLMIGF